MAEIKLNVKNLGKHFGSNRVFRDISFSHTNGVLGIAGSNGSGKSTLLQCLTRLSRPTSGIIKWQKNEQNVDDHNIKKLLGYAAPYINLYEELSGRENLEFLLKLRNAANLSAATEKALSKTDMLDIANQPFGKLSTGQQQRMRLAAAIVHQPEILLLDEPGSNLDENGRMLIESLVAEFKEADKLGIIASNNPDELALCNRVYSVEEERFLK